MPSFYAPSRRRRRLSVRGGWLTRETSQRLSELVWPPRRRGRRRVYAFVRLAALATHPESRHPTGVFQAAYELKHSDRLDPHGYDALVAALDWFECNLRAPRTVHDPRAIFWFKPDAGEYTRRIWDLVHLLRLHDVSITIHTTRRPGQVVYEDEHQIAAIPPRR